MNSYVNLRNMNYQHLNSRKLLNMNTRIQLLSSFKCNFKNKYLIHTQLFTVYSLDQAFCLLRNILTGPGPFSPACGASVQCFSSFSYCSLPAHHNIAPASSTHSITTTSASTRSRSSSGRWRWSRGKTGEQEPCPKGHSSVSNPTHTLVPPFFT